MQMSDDQVIIFDWMMKISHAKGRDSNFACAKFFDHTLFVSLCNK